MKLQEIRQHIQTLSQTEKLQLIQAIVADMLQGASPSFAPETAPFPQALQSKIREHLAALPTCVSHDHWLMFFLTGC